MKPLERKATSSDWWTNVLIFWVEDVFVAVSEKASESIWPEPYQKSVGVAERSSKWPFDTALVGL